MDAQLVKSSLFLIIGSMKSGTSTLHRNLMHHPQICATRTKECNYFSKHFSRGFDWYSRLFDRRCAVYMDTSPSYSRRHLFPDCAANAAKEAPDAKILFIVRHPIERIVSHLHHDLMRDRLPQSRVNEHALMNSDYVMTSSYHFQISEYYNHFPERRIMVITTDELKQDFARTMSSVCSFIGVDHGANLNERNDWNVSERRYWIMKHDFVHRNLPPRIAKLYHGLFYLANRRIARPILASDTIHELKLRLADDMRKFHILTGVAFPMD